MGSFCCKPSPIEEEHISNKISIVLTDKQANESDRLKRDDYNKKFGAEQHPGTGCVPKAAEGECIAAGWPPWLASVAGEAIRGWVPRHADSFKKLDKIGQGTYSSVYRACDLDRMKTVALKKVRLADMKPESVCVMAREIQILRRLDHPNVIKLEGLVASRMSRSLYLVFEYMEHDLTGLASNPNLKFSEPQIKCYMQQLLRGLDHCHSNGVLHRDIKGSNLLIDNNGILKLADFGLSTFFDTHQSQPLTSRVVTLWYRSPELLLGATYYGPCVDLWSTGCILAELYAGKPIMPARTEVEQLHKIFKLCGSPSEEYWTKSKLPHAAIFKPKQPYRRCVADTFKNFPAPALSLIETLLSIDPADRGTAASALSSEYFSTKPLPCKASSLPRYPPSKELDARTKNEEARRQGAAAKKGERIVSERRGLRESRVVPAPDINNKLTASMQRRQAQSTSKSQNKKFKPRAEEFASGFAIDFLQRPSPVTVSNVETRLRRQHKRSSHSGHSGLLVQHGGENMDNVSSVLSGSTTLRSLLSQDLGEFRPVLLEQEASRKMTRFRESFKEVALGDTRTTTAISKKRLDEHVTVRQSAKSFKLKKEAGFATEPGGRNSYSF